MNVRLCVCLITLLVVAQVSSTRVHRGRKSKRSSPSVEDDDVDFPSFADWKKSKKAEKHNSHDIEKHSDRHSGHISHESDERHDSYGSASRVDSERAPSTGSFSHQYSKKGDYSTPHDSEKTAAHQDVAPVGPSVQKFEDDDSEIWDTFEPDDSYISRVMSEFLTVRRSVTETTCNANAGPKDFCLCTVGRTENFACDFDCSCLDGICEASACNLTGRFIGITLIAVVCLCVAPISFYFSRVLAETPLKGQPSMDFEQDWHQGMMHHQQIDTPSFPGSKDIVSEW